MTDIYWPFFQKPNGLDRFERICDNSKFIWDHMYLIRDRRDGFDNNDYIGIYHDDYYGGYLIDRFVIYFYKNSHDTNWTKLEIPNFSLGSKYKFLDFTNTFPVPKKLINNCSESIQIYNLFESRVFPFWWSINSFNAFYNSSNIKQYVKESVEQEIKMNPKIVNELPKDLQRTLLGVVSGGRRRSKRYTKQIIKTHKIKKGLLY